MALTPPPNTPLPTGPAGGGGRAPSGGGPVKARAVVIDDSAYNRQTIIRILEESGLCDVVGRAADGEEGLRLCFSLVPDLVTLDLEMPKMDGFTFLRILMAKRPLPVVVIGTQSRKQDVFKALELGALDFVAKPSRHISPELHGIRDELVEKINLIRHLRMPALAGRVQSRSFREVTNPAIMLRPPAAPEAPARHGEIREPEGPSVPFRVVALGASTGGPPALTHLLSELDPRLPLAFIIAQHMPEKFTRAFADRLARKSGVVVREAVDGDRLRAGVALVAPGWADLTLERDAQGLRVSLVRGGSAGVRPGTSERYIPSVNAMLRSAAEVAGPNLMAVILTGMGDDGREAVPVVRARGGFVVAEAEESAVIFGMPKEAISTGCVDKVLPLNAIVEEIRRFAKEPIVEQAPGRAVVS